jgi:hypothetical protein
VDKREVGSRQLGSRQVLIAYREAHYRWLFIESSASFDQIKKSLNTTLPTAFLGMLSKNFDQSENL